MKTFLRIAIAAAAATLAACHPLSTPPPKQSPSVIQPVVDANAAAIKKASVADQKEDETRSLAAANVTNIQKANTQNPPGPTKETIADEAALALLALGTSPDAKELLAGEQRARLRAEGKADAAEKLSTESAARANAAVAEVAVARAERDAARQRVTDVLTEAAAQIAATNAEHDRLMKERDAENTRKLSDLKRQLEAKDVGFISKIIAGIGGLCLIAAIGMAVASFYSPVGFNPKNAVVVGILVVSAAGCFSLIRFLAHPWIPYAVGGVILAGFITAAVVWFNNWRHTRDVHQAIVDSEAELKRKLADMTETAAHVVDQTEDWAKKFPTEAKSLFDKIEDVTDQKHKQLIAWLKSIRPSKGTATTT